MFGICVTCGGKLERLHALRGFGCARCQFIVLPDRVVEHIESSRRSSSSSS